MSKKSNSIFNPIVIAVIIICMLIAIVVLWYDQMFVEDIRAEQTMVWLRMSNGEDPITEVQKEVTQSREFKQRYAAPIPKEKSKPQVQSGNNAG